MSEWLKVPLSKSGVAGNCHPGFESLPLRQILVPWLALGFDIWLAAQIIHTSATILTFRQDKILFGGTVQDAFPELLAMVKDNFASIVRSLFELHEALGERGRTLSSVNTYGDNAMLLDVESENVVIGTLSGLMPPRMIVRSEEHGIIEIGKGTAPVATLYLDGIDGSDAYLNNTGCGYGTLFALAPGDNPQYEDIVFSCMVRPDICATVYRYFSDYPVLVMPDGRPRLILPTPSRLMKSSLVFTDDYSELVSTRVTIPLEVIGYRNLCYTKTTSGNLYSVVAGGAQGGLAIIEEIDKGAIEMPAMFHLVRGVGGAMISLDGSSLDKQYINTFGASGGEIFVLARSYNIATQLVRDINI